MSSKRSNGILTLNIKANPETHQLQEAIPQQSITLEKYSITYASVTASALNPLCFFNMDNLSRNSFNGPMPFGYPLLSQNSLITYSEPKASIDLSAPLNHSITTYLYNTAGSLRTFADISNVNLVFSYDYSEK